CVVFPKTSTSCRDQTISSISPAAPDSTKMTRMRIGTRSSLAVVVMRPEPYPFLPTRAGRLAASDDVGPIDPHRHHHDAEDDQDAPADPDRTAGRRRARAQRDHERHRVEEVAV